jgi:hypothetical protein
LIFSRISRNNKEEVLSKAENDLAAVVNQHIGKLVKELHGTDFWKLRRAYTFGVSINICILYIYFARDLTCHKCCRYKNILKLQRFVDFARLVLY